MRTTVQRTIGTVIRARPPATWSSKATHRGLLDSGEEAPDSKARPTPDGPPPESERAHRLAEIAPPGASGASSMDLRRAAVDNAPAAGVPARPEGGARWCTRRTIPPDPPSRSVASSMSEGAHAVQAGAGDGGLRRARHPPGRPRQALRRLHRRRRRRPRRRPRRVLHAARAVGLGQDDDAAAHRRLRAARRGPRRARAARTSRAGRRSSATSTRSSRTTRCSRTCPSWTTSPTA